MEIWVHLLVKVLGTGLGVSQFNKKNECTGGSSMIFSKALAAKKLRFSTGLIIAIFRLPKAGFVEKKR